MTWRARKLWGGSRVSAFGLRRASRCCAGLTVAAQSLGLIATIVALSLSVVADGPAGASPATVAPTIYFYSNIPAAVTAQNPPAVHPSLIPITEDGSSVMEDLHWTGWGSSVARAVGVSSSSTCQPNCATGHRLNSPVRITLSSPGQVLGYEVYRCFLLTFPSSPRSDEQECIGRLGSGYAYVNSKPPLPSPSSVSTAAEFYSVPGWSCGMSSERVGCESAREETVHLLPSGEVDICHVKGTSTNPNPCDVGNPGLGVPTISNGTQLTVAPFRCSFTREALTCIVIKLARGFRLINAATVIRVGPGS